MEITEKTKIKYTIQNKDGDNFYIILSMEQIEGSVPHFYKQIRKAFEFDSDEEIKIVKREIVKENRWRWKKK